MTRDAIFSLWAPAGATWSAWVKPVLFAKLPEGAIGSYEPLGAPDVGWAPPADGKTAVVVDLPGDTSVAMGVALAEIGYRPIPLYNSVPGPAPVVEMGGVAAEILRGTDRLRELRLPLDAPPAFLLDSRRRLGARAAEPGMLDNRSVSLPTDFPSANLLMNKGFRNCVLVQRMGGQPQADLAHTLRRWQAAGMEIVSKAIMENGPALPIRVFRPSHYRFPWQRFLALIGLRRSPLGGFGGVLTVPSSG